MLEGHQIDGLYQFLIADSSVSLSYIARLVSVAENGFTNLRIHTGPTGIGLPGVAEGHREPFT